jgi:hypothetical protein
LEKKSAGDIVDGADHALGFPILLRGIWAGHAEGDTFGKKEGTRGGVIKLTAVVTLHRFDGAAVLRGNMSEKIRDSRKSIRL